MAKKPTPICRRTVGNVVEWTREALDKDGEVGEGLTKIHRDYVRGDRREHEEGTSYDALGAYGKYKPSKLRRTEGE